MTELEELKRKQDRIIQLVRDITSNYDDISIPDIVYYLEYTEAQISSFNILAREGKCPKFLNRKIDWILEKLEQGAENPDQIRDFLESLVADGNHSYKRSSRSALVFIPFDIKLPAIDYNGNKQPISITQLDGQQMGIVAYRSTSRFKAEGDVFVHQVGMTPDIESSMRIAIKRVDKLELQTDRYYLIIEYSELMHIRALLPGDDDKTVKYLSTIDPGSPYIILPLEKIAVMFCIIDGHFIPTPKRNNITTSTSQ